MLTFDENAWQWVNGPDWGGTNNEVTQQIADDIDRVADLARRRAFAVRGAGLESSFFERKRREADAFTLSPVDASAPLLAAEALERGITTQALDTRVLAKSNSLATLEAKISGNAGRHQDNVKALAGRQNILNYLWNVGWPPASGL